MTPDRPPVTTTPQGTGAWTVFLAFLRLGLTSFGGPVAHLGYFRDAFVLRRQWLSEQSYADLVALCQFLPGPASSQVGMGIGLVRAGLPGALAAWVGFTLPSAVAMILFAIGMANWADIVHAGVLHGLKIAAVAVVAQAVWGMARNLCIDVAGKSIAIVSACLVLAFPSSWAQIGTIIVAAVAGMLLFHARVPAAHEPLPLSVSRRLAIVFLLVFTIVLFMLPIVARSADSGMLDMVDAFYRAGSLVFGGGHVLLPLLQAEVVPTGWISNETFLAGYGAAQAVPGPLFTFAAFLGASMHDAAGGWLGGLVALTAIFVPSFLLICGAMPFWDALRGNLRARAALSGINAAVVGLLLAALYQPVWTSAIMTAGDFSLALLALACLTVWRLPPWLVVVLCGLAGWGAAVLL
ncbi:MAG TPA: chromate efflux transporter [Burkholderiaceae bacterium]|nr:chromate efflux transporter [Burkholderiaceae bacterium]